MAAAFAFAPALLESQAVNFRALTSFYVKPPYLRGLIWGEEFEMVKDDP